MNILSQKQPSHCDFCVMPLPKPVTEAPSARVGYGIISAGGYGKLPRDMVACYSCCGWLCYLDMAAVQIGERCFDAFYYDENKRDVSNWPGSVRMRVIGKGARNRVPFTHRGVRYQVYFEGPLGTWWSGTYYNTTTAGTLLRNVRRIKKGKYQ
jgi:hypothetical protein